MDKLAIGLAGRLIGNQIKDDDFVDRLHYFVTSAALLVLATGVLYQENGGEPIHCWPPKGYQQDSYKETLNSYCAARELYRPGDNASRAFDDDDRDGFVIDFGTAFFRWVPLVLILQAFTFKFPNMIWRQLTSNVSGDLNTIRELVLEARALTVDRDRRHKMDEVVAYFETWVTRYKTYTWRCAHNVLAVFFCLGRESGSYLSSLYLFIKFINLVNIFLNVGVLTGFFDVGYWKYGFRAIDSIFSNGDWSDPYNFPRVLVCDFTFMSGGSGTSASTTAGSTGGPTMVQVECIMSINVMLEKAFLLQWFWLAFLMALTFFNLCVWWARIKQPCSTFLFVKDYIEKVDSLPETDDGTVSLRTVDDVYVEMHDRSLQKAFADDYLRSDGVFILRLLEMNTDRFIVGEVVICLWNRYIKIQKFKGSTLSLHSNKNTYTLESISEKPTKKSKSKSKFSSSLPFGNLGSKLDMDNLAYEAESGSKNLASSMPAKLVTSPGLGQKLDEIPSQAQEKENLSKSPGVDLPSIGESHTDDISVPTSSSPAESSGLGNVAQMGKNLNGLGQKLDKIPSQEAGDLLDSANLDDLAAEYLNTDALKKAKLAGGTGKKLAKQLSGGFDLPEVDTPTGKPESAGSLTDDLNTKF